MMAGSTSSTPHGRRLLAAIVAVSLMLAGCQGGKLAMPFGARDGETPAEARMREDSGRFNATVLGGITGFAQAIAPALERRVRIFPHYYPDIHAQLAAAFGLDMIEESPDQADTVGFAPLRVQQPRIIDGHWHMTDAPGLGIVWNETALASTR